MGRVVLTHARGWQTLAATRSLGRREIEVYCGDEARFAACFFSRYCAGRFRHPSVADEPQAFVDFMVEKVRELRTPDGELPVLLPVHKETWLIAKHRERFEPHVRMAMTSHENMALVHDKGRLPELARQHDVLIPRTWTFTSVDDVYRTVPDLPFPAFLKMREGSAGVGLKKVNTPEELTTSFKEFVEGYDLQPEEYPLVQEFLPGEDYCVTVLFDHGRCVAKMTYHNVRAFPRGTGAGVLRETVELPDAEAAAVKLLSSLEWHGIAEVDFRKADDGPSYLIEVNPRLFGGLHQAVAANVDYPHLLYRLACGEQLGEAPEVKYDVHTEAPLVGLLATLQEIAHDERHLERLRKVHEELVAVGRSPVQDVKLRPLWEALKQAASPREAVRYFKSMFEKHRGSINDVLQGDDPLPVLGILFPLSLMIRHGKLSLGLLTSEAELPQERPRRRFRDLLRRPSWRTLALTAVLLAVAMFLMNWGPTRDNLGLLFGWPLRLCTRWFGDNLDPATVGGAARITVYYGLNVLYLFGIAALLRKQWR